MADTPATTPIMAEYSPGWRVSTPSRKTPRRAPAGMDPMVRPASRTEWEWRAPMAMASRIRPPTTGVKEIHHGGGSERIERGAQVGHGGGQDGGNQQTGEARWERTPDEGGINA